MSTRRRKTREVMVGDVGVGGRNPIRIQSMTTPATTDTAASVAQIERLVEAGCELVRLTVPKSGDAENLPSIRGELERRGIRVPLIADIHFTPAAALLAVEHVEKVRINPGNYADKKKFAVREYSDAQYAAELERIEQAVVPLIERCKELGRAMRIGTNHGSLSDRIMNRYGDTPLGMVESALEFVRICESHGYHELILSMKASNPLVVLQAYRLLVERMDAEGMDYPLHVGVTEAGDGEDARIKSAIGIGALLAEGLGDTVRVSLTEDPVHEIPVARALVATLGRTLDDGDEAPQRVELDAGVRRPTRTVRAGPVAYGSDAVTPVEVPIGGGARIELDRLKRELDAHVGPRVPEETRADVISVRLDDPDDVYLPAIRRLGEALRLVAPGTALSVDLGDAWAEVDLLGFARAVDRIQIRVRDVSTLVVLPSHTCLLAEVPSAEVGLEVARIVDRDRLLLALDPSAADEPRPALQRLADVLDEAGYDTPLVLIDRPRTGADDHFLLTGAAYAGGALCDGLGNAIQLQTEDSQRSRRLAFNVLQASRVRITKTEFISCPSCGRTLFDLEETTARIKARTAHLKGVKIAVMGCIVNGPGEMADADFGYVGWGEDKIALFVGKEMVERDIPTAEADDRLVALIKEHGRWVEPAAG